MANFILFITFLAIVWYSWETRRLVRLTGKQIRIGIEPIVVVEDVSGGQIKIKNVGKNTALNIKISTITKRIFKGCENSYDIVFIGKPILQPDTNCKIGGKPKIRESSGYFNPMLEPLLDFNNPIFLGDYEIVISYNDIEGGNWEVKTSISKEGVNFKEVKNINR
ncbi:MAG: hypothetical protein PHO70_08380 [Candidatus Omnitrophica bacterium]|nr:hypothetical protein [Candidatus Omnitrophota bacterium]